MSAHQRLFAWFAALMSLGAVGFVVFWLYGFPAIGIEGVYSLEHRRAIHAMESLADRERDLFERWFGNYRRELRVLVNSGDLLAEKKITLNTALAETKKLSLLKNLGSSGYESIYISDAQGEQLLASSERTWREVPLAHRAALQTSAQPGVLEFVHVLYDDVRPSLLIVHQIIAQDTQGHPTGELRGLLVAKVALLSPLETENIYALDKELGSRGALLLFDAWGRLLANSNGNESKNSFNFIGRAIVAEAEDVRVLSNERGDEAIAVFRHLHLGITEGVSLVVVSRTNEVLAITRTVFWRIATLGTVIFILAMGLVIFAARQIMQGERAVHQLNVSLEARVLARTSELALANERITAALRDLESTRDDLVHSEKLAALGALVAGIAHEMNTPLGNAVLVATTLQENETHFVAAVERGLTRSVLDEYMAEHQEGLALLASNLNRAAALVSSFKQLAMDQTSEQRRQFDVDAMVDEVLMVMSPTLRRTRHKLTTEVALGVAMDSFPGPLEQVLVNFINNALLHAFSAEQAGHMQIQATLHGQEVKIVFSDNGCGMDEDTQKRAFDPFFTTRLGQGGNGLGLHLAYNIVTSLLGGRIELVSTLGKGTTFTLYLPQVAPLTELSAV